MKAKAGCCRRLALRGCFGLLLGLLLLIVDAGAAEPVAYRLKWLFNISVIGDVYARDAGFFEAAGLAVDVKAGGPERDAIRELELGYADFGVASADQVIRARSKGAPVVVLAQLFQVNPLQWIYRQKEHTFDRLSDLKGKTIGITYGGNDEAIMRTLLAKAGIQEKEVSIYSVRYDYTPFYRRKADIWPVYRNAQGPILAAQLAQAAEQAAFFNPADYGVRFVANSVVTSERTLRQRPKLAEAFVKSLLKAWEAALDPDNAAKALAILRRYDEDTPPVLMQQQLAITRRLIKPTPQTAIGAIDVAAWQQTETIMRNQGLITDRIDIADALKPF